jgi:hypothetical protein
MAEDLRTLREAALAIEGLKGALDGKMTLPLWIVGGLGVTGLAVAGGLFYMLNDLSKAVARMEPQGQILMDIKNTLDRMASPPAPEEVPQPKP